MAISSPELELSSDEECLPMLTHLADPGSITAPAQPGVSNPERPDLDPAATDVLEASAQTRDSSSASPNNDGEIPASVSPETAAAAAAATTTMSLVSESALESSRATSSSSSSSSSVLPRSSVGSDSSDLEHLERLRVFARFRPETDAERLGCFGHQPAVDLSAGDGEVGWTRV
jgi:hypothetical protein